MGYVPGAENSAAAVDGLVMIYVWLPAACSLIVAIAMWRFPLDHERQRELRRVIEAREATGNARL
jgi:Na+/melibiose symporter-like transporter